MPDQKFSADPTATTLASAVVPIVQGSENKKAPIALFATPPLAGLTPNSTGAASANVTALQAALTAGGNVFIGQPGVYSVNATLVIGSNTTFRGVPGVIIRSTAGLNASVLRNLTPTTFTDVNIIVEDIIFDGDKANQTAHFATVYLERVRDFYFSRCAFRGALRTGTFPSVSINGEGIRMRNCDRGYFTDCSSKDNAYDGLKTLFCRDLLISNFISENDGRAGIQISFSVSDGGNSTTQPSERIIVNGLTVLHPTGTPHISSPTTSGIYIHGGKNCVVQNVTVNGCRQGIGMIENAFENIFNNINIRNRWDSGTQKAAIDFEGTNVDRNLVSNFVINPLSGVAGRYIALNGESNFNAIRHGYMSAGSGSGAWNINVLSSACDYNVLQDLMVPAAAYVLNNSGTNTQTINIIQT